LVTICRSHLIGTAVSSSTQCGQLLANEADDVLTVFQISEVGDLFCQYLRAESSNKVDDMELTTFMLENMKMREFDVEKSICDYDDTMVDCRLISSQALFQEDDIVPGNVIF
jgi:hypothetical protein